MFGGQSRGMMNLKFIILLSCFGCLSACNFSVSLKQGLFMDGFHRNMTYEINIIPYKFEVKLEIWPYLDCSIGIHQLLPPGIYANPDELSDLWRTEKLNAITMKTNIEMPADQAEPITVYVSTKLTGPRVETWVPLHARYHKAVRFGGYALNEIDAPQLYMRCPDDRLEKCEKPLTPAKFLCTREEKEKGNCGLKELPFTLETETPIAWQVPVGDLHHYYMVAILTTLAVTLGSLYLLQTIHEYKFIQDY